MKREAVEFWIVARNDAAASDKMSRSRLTSIEIRAKSANGNQHRQVSVEEDFPMALPQGQSLEIPLYLPPEAVDLPHKELVEVLSEAFDLYHGKIRRLANEVTGQVAGPCMG